MSKYSSVRRLIIPEAGRFLVFLSNSLSLSPWTAVVVTPIWLAHLCRRCDLHHHVTIWLPLDSRNWYNPSEPLNNTLNKFTADKTNMEYEWFYPLIHKPTSLVVISSCWNYCNLFTKPCILIWYKIWFLTSRKIKSIENFCECTQKKTCRLVFYSLTNW